VMEATENSMHTNEAHDTSYSVRAPARARAARGKAPGPAPAEPQKARPEWRAEEAIV